MSSDFLDSDIVINHEIEHKVEVIDVDDNSFDNHEEIIEIVEEIHEDNIADNKKRKFEETENDNNKPKKQKQEDRNQTLNNCR